MLRFARILILAGLGLLGASVMAEDAPNPRVVLTTSLGDITLELEPARAPLSVANFLGYVDRGFYDGLVFHRVIDGFVIQSGGYDAELDYREPAGRVRNESVGGLRNLRGTIAMARMQSPNSANSQFYINLGDNPTLDARGESPGYTVFGRVVEGLDVMDAIGAVDTGTRDGMYDVPVRPVLIERARRAPTAR